MYLKTSILLIFLILSGCATSLTHSPVPEHLVSKATVIDSPSIRFWGDEERDQYRRKHNLSKWLDQRIQEWDKHQTKPIINFLALSGGGEDGSFAAGIITGWTRHGDRPVFDVVTGVSAGALAAPFIFLGPEYDDILFNIYSNLGHKDIYRTQIFS
ncbi:MAG: patatin-like phospholipase family protein, partial [Gammaproteobacteria bacterium]